MMGKETLSLSGTVLAGGESRRMGRDKAMLCLNKKPLWVRQKQVLLESGAQPVTVVRKRGQPQLEGNPHLLYDTVDGAGPLAGLHAALLACRTNLLAVLAVDMPQIDAAWFRWLSGFCRPGVGTVVRIPSGFEPLAAIYPREALATVTSHLRLEDRSLQHLAIALVQAHRLVAVPLAESERHHLLNWNAPHDVARKGSLYVAVPSSAQRFIEGNDVG
jgi:molybdopterin-guanine dinucleotide biosynthesis protein A